MTSKVKNVKDLCEYIWYLEDKYDLFNLEINGMHPWAAYRMDMYYEIGKSKNVFDRNLNMKLTSKEKVYNFFKIFKNAVTNHSLLNLEKKDTLIFSHERSKLVENELIDPYTYYLKNDLTSKNISLLDFESPYKGKHERKKNSNTRYLDSILILRNIKVIYFSQLKK